MMGNRNLRALWVIPAVGFLLLALPADAQPIAGVQENVAAMSVQGGNLALAPQGAREAMTLRVSGGEFVSTESFRAGQTAWFAPVDGEGYQLPDGTYNWEITVAADRRGLSAPAFGAKNKAPADGRTENVQPAPRGKRQSGVFTIRNGVMVDPNLVEVRAPRNTAITPVSLGAPQSAASRLAERAGRADDGLVAPRARPTAVRAAKPPSAAARAAEHNDRDGN